MRPEPKFSPGEPAIVCLNKDAQDYERVMGCEGLRVVIISREWSHWGMWAYITLPSPPSGHGWFEKALRHLPPEELSGCFDKEELPREVTA